MELNIEKKNRFFLFAVSHFNQRSSYIPIHEGEIKQFVCLAAD